MQARVIWALVLREANAKFARHRLGYIWAFIEPIAFVAAFTLIVSVAGRSFQSGMPSAPFFITGIVPFFMFREVANATFNGLTANKALLVYPQVNAFDVMLARTLLEMVTGFIVFATLIVTVWCFGVDVRIERPVAVLGWLIAMGLGGFGFGAAVGAIEPLFPAIQRIMSAVVLRPLFWVSGVFFTAEMLPPNLRDLALLNPLVHVIEFLRSAFFHEFESRHAGLSYALFWLLGMVLLALLFHRALRRRILITIHAQ